MGGHIVLVLLIPLIREVIARNPRSGETWNQQGGEEEAAQPPAKRAEAATTAGGTSLVASGNRRKTDRALCRRMAVHSDWYVPARIDPESEPVTAAEALAMRLKVQTAEAGRSRVGSEV